MTEMTDTAPMSGNIFDLVSHADIDRDPFPHAVIENILPEADYAALEETFPSLEYIVGDQEVLNNTTYLATSQSVLADPRTPEPWRAYFDAHTQRSLYESVLKLWQPDIERLHPGLTENFGKPIEDFEVGQREGAGDSEANRRTDIVLDCQFGMNSPVTHSTSTRGPHVDRAAKVFSSLFYFRSERDDSTGGEYELYKLRGKPYTRNKMKKIPRSMIECVKRIPYRRNTLLTWLNSGESIHAVSPRSVTPTPRRYIAVSGECYGGAREGGYFCHFDEWDRPLARLRTKLKL